MKKRVFVISEKLLFLSIIIDILLSLDYEVAHAEDAESGINKIFKFKPDLIFIDLDMIPTTIGLKAIKTILANAQTNKTKLIVTHTEVNQELDEELQKLGIDQFISQPITEEKLISKINEYFGKEGMPTKEAFQEYHKIYDVEPYLPEIQMTCGYLTIWGTRGSIPISKQCTSRHGGNTACIEIRCGDDVFIFDAGSGITELGNNLAKEGPRTIHLFLTHTHWDHIQGFPFFQPAFIKGFEINIYGASSLTHDLRSILMEQQDRDYFPVQLEEMNAKMNFINIAEIESIKIGDITISWEHTYHPGSSMGFKIEGRGKKIAYLGDNEFLPGYLGPPHDITPNSFILKAFRELIAFIDGIDILIAEGQYTNEEYPSKIGWGHTSVSNGCLLAKLGMSKSGS